MIKKFTNVLGEGTKRTIEGAGKFTSKQIKKRGHEKSAQYVSELSSKLGGASGGSVKLVGQIAEGAVNTGVGFARKDTSRRNRGFDDLKGAGSQVVRSFVSLTKRGGRSLLDISAGAVMNDRERLKRGVWEGSQMLIVAWAAVDVVDFIVVDGDDIVYAESINDNLENQHHPVTNVPFERTEIDYAGQTISGVYPVFDSDFTATLPEDQYTATDATHFRLANAQLYTAIQEDPSLAMKLQLSQTDIQSLQSNETPIGYTWHHYEQPGQLQLVETAQHDQTAHTGGRYIWGGGTEART